ncbi:ilvB operon leader peptide IvbL [Brenneria rubrifaciens]|uniref:IlvB operon leader peptide IvbL n=1 Tax=Brenneria rubrifaciens TaxID=55213 RepID=A0A4P8QVM9_9GAMM|nr:ilvB operon leader peptide IvbL [Brenneria rubrifaciens]
MTHNSPLSARVSTAHVDAVVVVRVVVVVVGSAP